MTRAVALRVADAPAQPASRDPANDNGRPASAPILPTGPDVLTVPEVASLLRVSRNAVYAACARNALPHVRIGKHLRFSRQAIVRCLGSWSTQVAEE